MDLRAAGVERLIDTLIDMMFAAGIGSAAALSVGDGGVEVARMVRGRTQRVPIAGELIDESTWFDVASLTKPMVTTALAMTLVGERRLDLDAPVRAWVPEAATLGTVRDLLGHAAGCVPHVELFRRLRAGERCGQSTARAALVEMAAREPVGGAPGVTAVYSDLGYILLGAVLERAAGVPLETAFADCVASPLGLRAQFAGAIPLAGAVATELEPDGLVCGLVHDDNARAAGGICGHAGLFATIEDVARFAAAIVDCVAGRARGRLVPEVVAQFVTTSAAPGASWRLGWDTPAAAPGISQAGDRWPRVGGIGHLGFTGTSLWLDLPRRRWVALLTNRVHPTRDNSAGAIKTLRRAVNDAVVAALPA